MKRTIFLAMFQSKLQYGIAAWGCADSSQINIIQRLQNKAIKNLYNLEWRTSTNDIHAENKINKITQLHTKSAATHIFKMSRKLIHTNVELHDGKQHRTKASNTLRQHKVKSKYFGTSSVTFKSIAAYNTMPEEVKKSKDKWNFKKQMNLYINNQ